ncbi:unnamed protein product (macronuclear) [Paramecium tetraurelia]|uniref:Uncharacterized protein n=1 Tax=Paramecium tetraurelia TaxID=5888 RepID=A0E611_PARTE|nr:uncharacterized protein GSPATT00003591001 [Paramecium tetraurelia]CAK90728.1 unnamed protein product [Paramecium tetraurelia]|eukprot:XP_001458125.1 hypothetical protein (macronuclear) [Paramecium tetraurelia strain d4-2]
MSLNFDINFKAQQQHSKAERGTITFENNKEKQFIIQTWKGQVVKKSKLSCPKDSLFIPSINAKKQILFDHQKSIKLASQRSTQESTEKGLFNDKFINQNQERAKILQKLYNIRLQNVMMKQKNKSSNDVYMEYLQEQNISVDTQKVMLSEKLRYCQNEIDQVKQCLMKDEINLQEKQKELEGLKQQLKLVKDSILQIKNQNVDRTKEIIYKMQINQAKEKQLLTQIVQYIEFLQDQYSNHLYEFKDYLLQLRLNVNQIRMDQEYDINQ